MTEHPMTDAPGALTALLRWLRAEQPLGVAVSGGVDSMTLAVVAHRAVGAGARMFHAVSAGHGMWESFYLARNLEDARQWMGLPDDLDLNA